jgi:hypothetical protein
MAITSVNINNIESDFQGNNSPVILCVGMKNTLGTAIEGEIYKINTETDISNYFGKNSHIAQPLRDGLEINNRQYFQGTDKVEYYAIAFNQDVSGTKDSRTLTLSGSLSSDSTFTISIFNKVRFTKTISVVSTDALADITLKIKNIFDADTNFPFDLIRSGTNNEIITISSKLKGGVYKDFYVEYSTLPVGLSIVISSATNGGTLPTNIKDKLKATLDVFLRNKRVWYTAIENAFLDAESSIYDLVQSYKNTTGKSKQMLLLACKYDSIANLTTLLSGFSENDQNISFIVQNLLNKDNKKGQNYIPELSRAIIELSKLARTQTPNAVLSDLGISCIGNTINNALSTVDINHYLEDVDDSAFTADEYISLFDLKCGVIGKNNNISTLLPEYGHKTVSGITFATIQSYTYTQANLQERADIEFKRKLMTAGDVSKNDNLIDVDRFINKLLFILEEEFNASNIIQWNESIKQITEQQIIKYIKFNFQTQSIATEFALAVVKEILNVILNINPKNTVA